jgi:uncharacterized membrane protein YhaH (DUF805 family)
MNLVVALANGRLARGPFVLAVIAVYVASFCLADAAVGAGDRAVSVVPFVLVQIVLIWSGSCLHTRRLTDAGRPTGIVIGIAMIYVLEVVLLVLLIWLILVAAGRPRAPARSQHLPPVHHPLPVGRC